MSSAKPARAPKLDTTRSNPVDLTGAVLTGWESDAIVQREYTVGETVYGTERYIEYLPGNLPIIITVPHGGYTAPSAMPLRKGGTAEPDIHTQELARLLRESFSTVLRLPHAAEDVTQVALPHMIICRVQRGYLDLNRNEHDATGGREEMRQAWRQFHAFVRRAKREIVRGRSITNPTRWDAVTSAGDNSAPAASQEDSAGTQVWSRGLCVDLHGQSHDRRHQLGYILGQKELSTMSDAELDHSTEMIDKSSVRAAVDAPKGKETASAAASDSSSSSSPHLPPFGSLHPSELPSVSLSSIVRGRLSFGALLESLGQPCVPSPANVHAGEVMYFNGGYNTYVNGSSVLGVQQRKKERDTNAASSNQISAASAASTSPLRSDPDPSFTSLFTSTLEERCLLSIQLESAYEGRRDTEENMQVCALGLAKAIVGFVGVHVLREGEQFPTRKPRQETQ